MIVYPEGSVLLARVTPEDVPEIVEEHLLKGRIVTPSALQGDGRRRKTLQNPLTRPTFYAKQTRVALRNCGVINPENIDEYIGTRRLSGPGQGSHRDDPATQVIQTMHRLRPARPRRRRLPHRPQVEIRSGKLRPIRNMSAVTPTRATRAHSWTVPFWKATRTAVIEAMAIAGYAIGATQGYIYVRAEYPIAVQRLQIAINQAERIRPAWQKHLRHRL